MTTARALGLAICLAGSPAFALEQGEYRLNGFGTAGLTHLGGEDHGRSYGITGQTTDAWRGDQLSKLGGQFSYGLTNTLGVTVQAIAKADQDQWKGSLEWAYLSWQSTDNLMFRIGRLRTPMYMYSESLDVGFSYPWLRLPDEVYSQVQLSNYEGGDLTYTLPLAFGSVIFQVVGGQAKNHKEFALDDKFDIDYSKIFGANVSLASNDFGTLRLGYVEADVDTDVTADVVSVIPPDVGTVQPQRFLKLGGNKARFTSLGYQYDNGTWLTADEWTNLKIEGDGSGGTDAFYLMGGRRFSDFLAHLTYAQLDQGGGRQSSWTLGLNYNLLPTVVLKSEYKRVDTTGGYQGVFVRNAQETYENAAYDATGGAFGSPSRNYDGDIISVGVDFVF